jgi:WD40 repeat protein
MSNLSLTYQQDQIRSPGEKDSSFVEYMTDFDVFMFSSQFAAKQLRIFFLSCREPLQCFEPRNALNEAMACSVLHHSRCKLLGGGGFHRTLVLRLFSLYRNCIRSPLKHAMCVLSRRHTLPQMKCVKTLSVDAFNASITSIGFHPTLPLLAAGYKADGGEHSVMLWQMGSNKSPVVLTHGFPVTDVNFHPILPILATTSLHNSLNFFQVPSDRLSSNTTLSAYKLPSLNAHADTTFVNVVSFDPSGTFFATGASDKTAKVWELSSGKSDKVCVATLMGHERAITCLSFSSSGKLLATGDSDKTVKVWDLALDKESDKCVATLHGHENRISGVAFNNTSTLLATGSWDTTAKLWDLSPDKKSNACVATLIGHTSPITCVSFHPDAKILATGSEDKTVRIWRFSNDGSFATCVAVLNAKSPVSSVDFHPSGKFLAIGSRNGTVMFWQ